MKRKITQILLFLIILSLFTGCSIGSSAKKRPQLHTDFTQQETLFSFSPQPANPISLSESGASGMLAEIEALETEYPYGYLYQLEEVKRRLDFCAHVETHQYSALNADGKLDASHLTALVIENNNAFLSTKPFGYKPVEEDYIADLCDFLVKIVDAMGKKYPQIDWARVFCNLGNLKILYNTGMLSYAQVSSDMILSISKNNTEIVLNMKGEDGFSRVLTHEIMHILQIGCGCETIENCGRRAGICVYWDDFTLNTTDWTWMVEGAAERNMCKLTGGEAVSYQYKMDYLCSMTMSILLRDTVKPDTLDTLCFYSDPELLFDAFGCETQAQRDELLEMMITLQVLQIQPPAFMQAYLEATGEDLINDEEQMTQFCYSLKPAICISLAKEFYENLTTFLLENKLTDQDLCFLITLFEGHLNQHLQYKNEKNAQINAPFFQSYTALREALFTALEADNPELDLHTLYANYEITAGEGLLNANLSCLSQEKRDFLLERAQWQAELNGLGQAVALESSAQTQSTPPI